MLSHPLGRQWLNEELHARCPEIVPHPLPDQDQLHALISDLPLRLVEYVDEPELYMALLQVTILFPQCPRVKSSEVGHNLCVMRATSSALS